MVQGEQYLAADAPLNDRDALAALRPWMTLDLDPLDYRTLGDRLEGWSCFELSGCLFVVRLCPAGKYDQRPAYFSHGRAWRRGGWAQGFDPGAHLGDSAGFDRPWAGSARPQPFEPAAPTMIHPARVAQSEAAAAGLLAHLLSALLKGHRMVVAAPLASFIQDGTLHAVVSFARAALPERLKPSCSLRVYSRRLDLFLNQLGARLTVVPEDEAERLPRSEGIVLLDAQGDRRWGPEPDREMLEYAEAAVELACQSPASLLEFSSRADGLLEGSGLTSELTKAWISNAFLLSGGSGTHREQRIVSLFAKGLELPWKRLSNPAEATRLSAQAQERILLSGSEGLPLNRWQRELQELVQQSLSAQVDDASQGRRLQDQLDRALREKVPSPPNIESLRRASELRSCGLISARTAADLSSRVELRQLASVPDPGPLLEAEIKQQVFAKRSPQAEQLAELATNPNALDFLARLTSKALLHSGWAEVFLKSCPATAALRFAASFFQEPHNVTRQAQLFERTTERLLALGHASFHSQLVQDFRQAGDALDPLGDLQGFLKLLELRHRGKDASVYESLKSLWPRLGSVDSPQDRRFVVDKCLDDDWGSLHPVLLFTEQGELRLPHRWDGDVADQLLASDHLLDHLNRRSAIRLILSLSPDRREDFQGRIASWIDQRLQSDPAQVQPILDDLIASGIWRDWKAGSRLGGGLRRRCALAWMASRCWRSPETAKATIEDWSAVCDDIRRATLTSQELSNLTDGSSPSWPWVTPFQLKQVLGLAALACDLDSLATLHEIVVRGGGMPYGLRGDSLGRRILDASLFADRSLPDRLLQGLAREAEGKESDEGLVLDSSQLDLVLSESPDLLGRRRPWVLRLLGRGAAQGLGDRFVDCLETAARIDLQSDDLRRFRLGLAGRLQQHASGACELSPTEFELARGFLSKARPLGVGEECLATSLWYFRRDERVIARYLSPWSPIVDSLMAGHQPDDGRWSEIQERTEDGQAPHPLRLLARALAGRGGSLAEPELKQLQANGWKAIAVSLSRQPWLIEEDPGQVATLPALDLAAVLLAKGESLGQAGRRVVEAALGSPSLKSRRWWRQLARGLLQGCPRWDGRISAMDCGEAALRSLHEWILGLTLAGGIESSALDNLEEAWSLVRDQAAGVGALATSTLSMQTPVGLERTGSSRP